MSLGGRFVVAIAIVAIGLLTPMAWAENETAVELDSSQPDACRDFAGKLVDLLNAIHGGGGSVGKNGKRWKVNVPRNSQVLDEVFSRLHNSDCSESKKLPNIGQVERFLNGKSVATTPGSSGPPWKIVVNGKSGGGSPANGTAGEADKAKGEADKAKGEADKAKGEADKAKGEADKAKSEADKAKSEADKAKSEADKAKSEADKAKSEADKAKSEADKAAAAVGRATEAASQVAAIGGPAYVGVLDWPFAMALISALLWLLAFYRQIGLEQRISELTKRLSAYKNASDDSARGFSKDHESAIGELRKELLSLAEKIDTIGDKVERASSVAYRNEDEPDSKGGKRAVTPLMLDNFVTPERIIGEYGKVIGGSDESDGIMARWKPMVVEVVNAARRVQSPADLPQLRIVDSPETETYYWLVCEEHGKGFLLPSPTMHRARVRYLTPDGAFAGALFNDIFDRVQGSNFSIEWPATVSVEGDKVNVKKTGKVVFPAIG